MLMTMVMSFRGELSDIKAGHELQDEDDGDKDVVGRISLGVLPDSPWVQGVCEERPEEIDGQNHKNLL